MDTGWIKLHRKLLFNPLFKRSSYVHLWVYLLLKANHKPDRILWNNGFLEIKAGQFITGRKTMSKETGIPGTTIERILTTLENGQQIRQQTNSKYRLITILNWDTHQKADSKTDSKRTSGGHLADTNKNVKNEKKYNKSSSYEEKGMPQPFDEDTMKKRLAQIRNNLPILKKHA